MRERESNRDCERNKPNMKIAEHRHNNCNNTLLLLNELFGVWDKMNASVGEYVVGFFSFFFYFESKKKIPLIIIIKTSEQNELHLYVMYIYIYICFHMIPVRVLKLYCKFAN